MWKFQTMAVIFGLLLALPSCTSDDRVSGPSTSVPAKVTSSTVDPSPSTSLSGPTLDLSDATWVTHGLDGVRSDDENLIWETQPFPADIARDREGGLVFTDSAGLWWFRAGDREPSLVTAGGYEVLAVGGADGEQFAITWADGANAISLMDGRVLESPPNMPVDVLEESPWLKWNAGNGLTAWVTDPQVELDSEDQPSRILEPAHLVVSDAGGTLVDVPIAPPDRAWARIHDFDGQRLIVSRGPYEPAMPEESFLLVDLATGEAIEIFEAAATRATFPGGDSSWTGPLRQPELTNSN